MRDACSNIMNIKIFILNKILNFDLDVFEVKYSKSLKLLRQTKIYSFTIID